MLLIGLTCFHFSSQVAKADYDDDTSLDYSWTPAAGPVDHYDVYVSVNGGPFERVGETQTPSYTLTGAKDGAIYRLKVQAVDASGHTGAFSDESDATTVVLPFKIYLAEGVNRISFPVAKCYYQGNRPTAPLPTDIDYVNIADLGYATMAEWFDTMLVPNKNGVAPAWKMVSGFDDTGARVMDSTVPPEFHTLTYMSGGCGYEVEMKKGSGGGVLTFTGPRLSEQTAIPLRKGWNLIGYLPTTGYYDTTDPPVDSLVYTRGFTWVHQTSAAPNFVLTSITGKFRYLVGARPGSSGADLVFSPTESNNTLRDVSPGAGYWLLMNAAASLVYNTSESAAPPVVIEESEPLSTLEPTFATNRSAFLYGEAQYDSTLASAGSEVIVRTSDERIVGRGVVKTAGQYGLIAVYGDDRTTPEKDGAVEGEFLSVFLNGQLASQWLRWQKEHEVMRLDVSAVSPPKQIWLGQNFPNPFNPETWIPFALPHGSDVSIRIYNVSGHLVRTLNLGYHRAGWYNSYGTAAYWNGRNELEERVSSGVYMYQLVTPIFKQMRRLVVLK